MAHFMPYNKTVTSEETARFFMDNIYKYHGLSDNNISDRGSQFTSKFWQLLFKILKVKIKLSSAYYPQTDGQIKKINQVLEQYLRCTINYHQTIGQSCYHLLSLCTTTPSKDLFNRPHSLPTMGTI
jgi:transposase InsO family protein